MHSKSPVVNLAEPLWNTLVNKWVAVCNSNLLLTFKKTVHINLLIIHYDFSQNINDHLIL